MTSPTAFQIDLICGQDCRDQRTIRDVLNMQIRWHQLLNGVYVADRGALTITPWYHHEGALYDLQVAKQEPGRTCGSLLWACLKAEIWLTLDPKPKHICLVD